jgi:hypothetical protein
MSWTNAIFRVDIVNGDDTPRPALTSCTIYPDGSNVRILKTSHGLVNGTIVTLSGFDPVFDEGWKITVIDADNFELDGAVWSVPFSYTGDVTRLPGARWDDAFISVGFGGAGDYAIAGDEIRVSKTSDPTSIGNVIWTDGSNALTMSIPVTKEINDCDNPWTASLGMTGNSMPFDYKEGSAAVYFTDASYTPSTLYSYYALGDVYDFSQYNAISCWYKYTVAGNTDPDDCWRICLCSDSYGLTVVDEFILPGYSSLDSWRPWLMPKFGGPGQLGSSIQSIAIYTGTNTPSPGQYLWLDNIIACQETGSLSLVTPISKNSSSYGGTEAWYPIQSITEDLSGNSIIILDTETQTSPDPVYGQYSGETGTYTTYIRDCVRYLASFSPGSLLLFNSINNLTHSFGWNVSNDTQDGATYYDGLTSNGVLSLYDLSMCTYNYINRVGAIRFYEVVGMDYSDNNNIELESVAGNAYGVRVLFSNNNDLSAAAMNNSSTGLYLADSQSITASIGQTNGNIARGIDIAGGGQYNVVISNSNRNSDGVRIGNNADVVSLNVLTCSYNGNSSLNIDSCTNAHLTCSLIDGSYQGVYFSNVNFSSISGTIVKNCVGIAGLNINNVRHCVFDFKSIYDNQGSSVAFNGSSDFTFSSEIVSSPNVTGPLETMALSYCSESDINISIFSGTLGLYKSWFNKITLASASTQPGYYEVQNDVGVNYLRNSVIEGIGGDYGVYQGYHTAYANSRIFWHDYNSTGESLISTDGGRIISSTTDRPGGSGKMWALNVLSSTRDANYPLDLSIGQVYCNSGSNYRIKAWLKKNDSTGINGKLVALGGTGEIISNTLSGTLASNTNWQELSISFTPHTSGMLDLQVWAEFVLSTYTVYYDQGLSIELI